MSFLKPKFKQVRMLGGPYNGKLYEVDSYASHIYIAIVTKTESILSKDPSEWMVTQSQLAIPIKKDTVSIAWIAEWDYEQEALLRGVSVEELWLRDGKTFGLKELAKKYPPKKISDHSNFELLDTLLAKITEQQLDWTASTAKLQAEINLSQPLEGETMGNVKEVTILDILRSVLDIEPLSNEDGYRLKPKGMKPIPCSVCDEQGVFQIDEEVDGVISNTETMICPVCKGEGKFDIKFHWMVSHEQLAAAVKEFNAGHRRDSIRRI